MQKRELLHLHILMFQIRIYFEGITHDEIRTERYNSLGISPLHFHKGKKAHKDALLTLGDEIMYHILGKKLPVVDYTRKTASFPLAAADQAPAAFRVLPHRWRGDGGVIHVPGL